MSSERNDTQRLIKKYQGDIVSLEEKEEYLTRRIQVMENLIPTVMVWYMWKAAQEQKPGTFSQSHSEEDAKKQLVHLENILEELQEADYILKEEEKVMRSRIEELESSILRESGDEPFPKQKDVKENEAAKERRRIKALEEGKIQFKDLLEDPNTDWPNKCRELCDKVNDLTNTLEDTNNSLKNKDGYIRQLQDDLRGKGSDVDEKIKALEKQNKVLFSEVINSEKERDAEEAYVNRKVYSAVQEAIEEVGTLKKSLTKETTPGDEGKDRKDIKTKFSPRHHSITEEVEEETRVDSLDKGSRGPQRLEEFYQKPLVLTPDEVLPGAHTSARGSRPSVPPLPQIFESLQTVKELSSQTQSQLKLRTTATGTVISIPPDVPEAPSVKLQDTSFARSSLSKAEPVSQDVLKSQPAQPVSSSTVARKPELTVPTPTAPIDVVKRDMYPSENDVSGIKTKVPDTRVKEEQSVSAIPRIQKEVSHTHTRSSKSLVKTGMSSTEAKAGVEQPHESPLAPGTKSEVLGALKNQPESTTKVTPSRQVSIEKSVLVKPTVSAQNSKAARSSVPEVQTGVPTPELNTIFVKSDPEKPKLTSGAASEKFPSTSKAAADTSEAQAIVSEPREVPFTDGVQPTPSGLALQQEAGTLHPRPSVDSLTGQTLQSKCRVKDHLIKNMADDLKDLAKKNMWSGNKLFKDISSDPVKTYDFDRSTLYKYIKGQEPRDLAPSLKSNDPYSASNPLKVKLGRKLDLDSILLEWGPSPSHEVVGFQIFINGEFKYWVHSAKRSKALLHPVDLSARMDITVSPVNAKGDIVHRSSVTYSP